MKRSPAIALSLGAVLAFTMFSFSGCGGGSGDETPVQEKDTIPLSIAASTFTDGLTPYDFSIFFDKIENGYDSGTVTLYTDYTSEGNTTSSYTIECDGTSGIRCEDLTQVSFYFNGFVGDGDEELAEFWCEYYLQADGLEYPSYNRQSFYIPTDISTELHYSIQGKRVTEGNTTILDTAYNDALAEILVYPQPSDH